MATRSPHKLAEVRDILSDLPARLIGLEEAGVARTPAEDTLEPYDTFAENALSKARYFARLTGLPTVADDSGLCVDALDGGPGVHTKRFAPADWAERWGRDEANNRWLLERLEDVPEGQREAHYRCAIAVVLGDKEAVFEGRAEGTIGFEPRGEGGFGYDPLFRLGEGESTYAELAPEIKRTTSHRARALRAAREFLLVRLEATEEE